MPVIRASEAEVHQMHGATFTSYATSGRGSTELRAWRVEIPAGTEGVAHRVTREEVLYVLSGTIRVCLGDQVPGDQAAEASAGDVIVVPAGTMVRADNPGHGPASAWVTTSAGFSAVLPDNRWIAPPWTR
jgi:quercetin dioxygenase-like cupin family protein